MVNLKAIGIYLLVQLFIIQICAAQKPSPIEYIDAGVKLIELFKKSKTKDSNVCIYEVKFKNSSDLSLEINILTSSSDSIINTLIVPSSESGSLYSLEEGIYRYKINSVENIRIKESEFILTECGTLEIQIK